MPIGTIPPWLNIQPQQFVEAARSGTAAGVSISAAQQRAREVAAEQARAAAAADARRWEFEQDLQRRAIEQSSARQQAAAQLAASERYNLARLAQDTEQNKAQAAHWQAIENRGAEPKIHFGAQGEVLSVDPVGNVSVLRAGTTPEKENIWDFEKRERKIEASPDYKPGIPATLGRKQSLGNWEGALWDYLRPDRAATPAIPEVGTPAQTITEYIPRKLSPTLDTFGTPYPPAPATNAPSGKRVRVKSPDGKTTGTISEENVDEALAAGYTIL